MSLKSLLAVACLLLIGTTVHAQSNEIYGDYVLPQLQMKHSGFYVGATGSVLNWKMTASDTSASTSESKSTGLNTGFNFGYATYGIFGFGWDANYNFIRLNTSEGFQDMTRLELNGLYRISDEIHLLGGLNYGSFIVSGEGQERGFSSSSGLQAGIDYRFSKDISFRGRLIQQRQASQLNFNQIKSELSGLELGAIYVF